MEENILIKSVGNKKCKNVFIVIMSIICLVSFVFLGLELKSASDLRKNHFSYVHSSSNPYNKIMMYGFLKGSNMYFINESVCESTEDMGNYNQDVYYDGDTYYFYEDYNEFLRVGKRVIESHYDYHKEEFYLIEYFYIFGYIHWGILFLDIILLLIYIGCVKCNLTITDKNLQGKAFFGKKVFLPLNKITSFSTPSFLSTLVIETGGKKTKFYMVGNLDEISSVLSGLINERQEIQTNNVNSNVSSVDELKKLKELLDLGVLTEEEFNAKKKEILGL